MVVAVGNFLKRYRDAAGNLHTQHEPDGGRVTNTWDAENHLTLAQVPVGIVNTMTYRADGLRVEKEDGDGTSKFIWDGQNILAETDGNDATQAAYTLQPLAYGNLLSQRRGENSHFFHFDGLGSTDRLTDALQAITDSYCYAAYGQLLGSSGNTVNPFIWVGRVGYFEDAELGQYYVRARHYDPVLARWLSEDPISELISHFNPALLETARLQVAVFGTLQPELMNALAQSALDTVGRNAYVYANSNSVLFIDPTGLLSCKLKIAAFSAACTATATALAASHATHCIGMCWTPWSCAACYILVAAELLLWLAACAIIAKRMADNCCGAK